MTQHKVKQSRKLKKMFKSIREYTIRDIIGLAIFP
jgi:hypothetical protein